MDRFQTMMTSKKGHIPSLYGSRAPALASGPTLTVNTRESLKEMQQLRCNESLVEPAP